MGGSGSSCGGGGAQDVVACGVDDVDGNKEDDVFAFGLSDFALEGAAYDGHAA